MLKLKILGSWVSPTQNTLLQERFINNFDLFNEYEYTVGNDYDYIIMFNSHHPNENSNIDWERTILFVNEPSWYCKSSSINNNLHKPKYLITHDKNLLSNNNIVIESPSIMFNHFNNKNIKYLMDNDNFNKKHKLSIVVSNKNINSDVLYNWRIDYINKLLNSDIDFHLFGNGWNLSDKRYKGSVDDKYDSLIDYEYSICIENSAEKNYVSEKFFDCLLTNTIPIYKGSPNIEEVYDKNGFCLLEETDLKNLKPNIIFKEELIKNKLKYQQVYNPLTILKNIINKK